MKEEKCDMVNDVAQLECNNNKYYTLVFRYYMVLWLLQNTTILFYFKQSLGVLHNILCFKKMVVNLCCDITKTKLVKNTKFCEMVI